MKKRMSTAWLWLRAREGGRACGYRAPALGAALYRRRRSARFEGCSFESRDRLGDIRGATRQISLFERTRKPPAMELATIAHRGLMANPEPSRAPWAARKRPPVKQFERQDRLRHRPSPLDSRRGARRGQRTERLAERVAELSRLLLLPLTIVHRRSRRRARTSPR